MSTGDSAKSSSELKVFITQSVARCSDCGENLGRGAWITLLPDRDALCLPCADLDHLEFLPSGDAALTRRSRKHSTLCAVVLKWSRARKRYERQGLLVEQAALERAEQECLSDSDAREQRRQRAAERRATLDEEHVERFAAQIRRDFPSCPVGREEVIAEHACLKFSGRIGRSASGKSVDAEAVQLAVVAHVRHVETNYDALLASGVDRHVAREMVRDLVSTVIDGWTRRGS